MHIACDKEVESESVRCIAGGGTYSRLWGVSYVLALRLSKLSVLCNCFAAAVVPESDSSRRLFIGCAQFVSAIQNSDLFNIPVVSRMAISSGTAVQSKMLYPK